MSERADPAAGLATETPLEQIRRMHSARSDSDPPVLFSPGISGRRDGEVVPLENEEVRHVRALRLQADDPVRLTDGAGTLWRARLSSARGNSVECVLEEPVEPARRLPVTLAFAVGQKAHVLWLVEKATELGVARLCPLEASRSRSVADAGRSAAFWRKTGRRAISALKQSGGAWLPLVEQPAEVDEFLARGLTDGGGKAGPRVRLDADGRPLRNVLHTWNGYPELSLVVGPEGGWTDAEAEAFDAAGYSRARLGPLVLRFETAALAGLAVAAQQIITRSGTDGTARAGSGGG